MRTVANNWTGALWVICSCESADGGSGWDADHYGPFHTLVEAHAVARELNPGTGRPQAGKAKLLVEIVRAIADDVEVSCENGDTMPGSTERVERREYMEYP